MNTPNQSETELDNRSLCERALDAMSEQTVVPPVQKTPLVKSDGVYINKTTRESILRFSQKPDENPDDQKSPFAPRGKVKYNRKTPVQYVMVSPYRSHKIITWIAAVLVVAAITAAVVFLYITYGTR